MVYFSVRKYLILSLQKQCILIRNLKECLAHRVGIQAHRGKGEHVSMLRAVVQTTKGGLSPKLGSPGESSMFVTNLDVRC